mmetsp:Transcript_119772/g.346187  ORF Transcript_119772/g.346187 Transcript_119772/m.346187 type:complete len:426 (-) Transcript_119772:20-1297(-)
MAASPRSGADKASGSSSISDIGDAPGNDVGPCKLFVGGLSTQTTTEALRSHFSKYGPVLDAVVMSKHCRPRGFGFVTLDQPSAVSQALAEPQSLDGRLVDVKRAVPGDKVQDRASNKLFVGGLKQDVTTEELRRYFSKYGVVTDAVVMVDRRTNRSRGFGFVRFHHGPAGCAAIEAALADYSVHTLRGKWVEVKTAAPAALLQGATGPADSPELDFSAEAMQASGLGMDADLNEWFEALQACSGPFAGWSDTADIANYFDWSQGFYAGAAGAYEAMALRRYLTAFAGAGQYASVPRTRGRRGRRRKNGVELPELLSGAAAWLGTEGAQPSRIEFHGSTGGVEPGSICGTSGAEADRSTRSGHSDGPAEDDDEAMETMLHNGAADASVASASAKADLSSTNTLSSGDAFTREAFLKLEARPCMASW